MRRGYAAIGLWRPKDPSNIGGAMRAAFVYDAQLVCVAGERPWRRRTIFRTDTPMTWRHVPTLQGDDLRAMMPFGCSPVAVDLVPNAKPLPEFQHPARAYYLFGPEDGTLDETILSWCQHRVFVPTRYCMNLAATVNVVLYDRAAKSGRAKEKAAEGYGERSDAPISVWAAE